MNGIWFVPLEHLDLLDLLPLPHIAFALALIVRVSFNALTFFLFPLLDPQRLDGSGRMFLFSLNSLLVSLDQSTDSPRLILPKPLLTLYTFSNESYDDATVESNTIQRYIYRYVCVERSTHDDYNYGVALS